MKQIPILNEDYEEIFARDLRCYMVKTEAEFQQLALGYYYEELKKSQKATSDNNSTPK